MGSTSYAIFKGAMEEGIKLAQMACHECQKVQMLWQWVPFRKKGGKSAI